MELRSSERTQSLHPIVGVLIVISVATPCLGTVCQQRWPSIRRGLSCQAPPSITAASLAAARIARRTPDTQWSQPRRASCFELVTRARHARHAFADLACPDGRDCFQL